MSSSSLNPGVVVEDETMAVEEKEEDDDDDDEEEEEDDDDDDEEEDEEDEEEEEEVEEEEVKEAEADAQISRSSFTAFLGALSISSIISKVIASAPLSPPLALTH